MSVEAYFAHDGAKASLDCGGTTPLFFHVLLAPSALESPHRFRPAYSAVKAGTCPRSPKPRHSLGRVKCPGQGKMNDFGACNLDLLFLLL